MTINTDEHRRAADHLIRESLPAIGEAIVPTEEQPSFREARIEDAFVRVLGERGAKVERTGALNLPELQGWKGAMKKWDLELTIDQDDEATVYIEAKVDDVRHSLWDAFKLVSSQTWAGIRDGYLAVACETAHWNSDGPCVALFAEDPPIQGWLTRDLIESYQAAWTELLGPNGSAKPFELPDRFATRFIGRTAVAGFPMYELRVVAVARPGDAGTLDLDEHGQLGQ